MILTWKTNLLFVYLNIMKTIQTSMKEIYDAMRPNVYRNKKKYTRKKKHKRQEKE